MRMSLPYETTTAEGRKIPAGAKVLLDMRYFLEEQVQPAGATGDNNAVADEFNDSVIENARLNPPTEPKIDQDPVYQESDDVEGEEPVAETSVESDLRGYDGRTTFARGAPFPAKYLSAPTCDCPRGCGTPSKYGPRARPVTGYRVIKRKGRRVRVPARWGSAFHEGNDISGNRVTGASIVAAADAVVKWRGLAGGYGYAVYLDHGNGIETIYGHMKTISPQIRLGVVVRRGEKIGTMGSTGNSSGPHLHFEVRKDRRPINAQASMLVDMHSNSAFSRSCRNLPKYPEVDRAMDRALRGALNGTSRTQTSGGARSTSSR
ncbi:MAG: M23 family metallopeptidase [Proteobacteria bacterium]|nr:MAG: M23 family metallopeptidase [Pseudomonadota bacterium]